MAIKKYEGPVFDMDYGDFDELIDKYFHKDWTEKVGFLAAREANNDTQHDFGVDGTLEDYDLEDLEEWKQDIVGAGYCSPGVLLNWLVKEGHIEPGRYIIDVCW